ncbi:MAG: hypothetical protein GY722_15630 [bacterium]|nr:hypothetical protein [bacterium]
MEKRGLPGNDASWYRALLIEQSDESAPEPLPPEQQSLLVQVDAIEPEATDTAAEPPDPDTVVQAPTMTGDTEPVAFPDELGEDATEEEPDSAQDEAEDIATLDGEAETTEVADAPQPADVEETPVVASVPPTEPDQGAIDNTSEMVGQLWTAQEPDSPLDDWAPDEMNSKITSSRPFRWTSVIAALAVIGLIVVGLVLLPSITRNRADGHRDMMTAALWDLRSELPDTQASLETATEPTASVTALNDLSTQLTVLSARASAVDEAGRSDLPAAPPFTSKNPIDELAPIQQRLEPLATTAHAIQRRIGNLVEYRTLLNGFLALPDLPSEADSAEQADLRVTLASAQAESASILADLPNNVSLSEHQDLARSINEQFATWQIDYLEALRTLAADTAQQLVGNLEGWLDDLDAALVTPLAQIRRQADADLIDLARAIDEVMSQANSLGETG